MTEQSARLEPWESLGYERRDVEATASQAVAMFTGPAPHELEQIAMLQRAAGINPPPTIRDSSGWELPPDAPEMMTGWMFTIDVVGLQTFALGALGYTIDHPVLCDWREAGRRVVTSALYYFFGRWREKGVWYDGVLIDPKQARAKLPWIDYYRDALAIALSLGDWKSGDRLLEWPGPDVNEDEGCDDRTAEDNAYQIWLAMRLRGESGPEVDSRRDLIAKRSRQRPKLLALAADALLAAECDQFAKALSDYLKYYRKREIDLRPTKHARPAQDGICLDGTTLWHLARRHGMGEVPLAADDMPVIARC